MSAASFWPECDRCNRQGIVMDGDRAVRCPACTPSSAVTFEVFDRPHGGERLMFLHDVNRTAHAYRVIGNAVDNASPLCGADCHGVLPPKDSDPMCEACSGLVESWAVGGATRGGSA